MKAKKSSLSSKRKLFSSGKQCLFAPFTPYEARSAIPQCLREVQLENTFIVFETAPVTLKAF